MALNDNKIEMEDMVVSHRVRPRDDDKVVVVTDDFHHHRHLVESFESKFVHMKIVLYCI